MDEVTGTTQSPKRMILKLGQVICYFCIFLNAAMAWLVVPAAGLSGGLKIVIVVLLACQAIISLSLAIVFGFVCDRMPPHAEPDGGFANETGTDSYCEKLDY